MKRRVTVAVLAASFIHCGARTSIDGGADEGGGGSGGSPVVAPTHSHLFILEAETFQGRSRVDGFDDISGAGFVSWEGDGSFRSSCSPVFDAQQRLYFADGFNRVVRLNLATGKYDSLKSAPTGDKSFTAGFLTLDEQGRIYVGDSMHHRIFRVDNLTGAGWVSFGEDGVGEGQFGEPDGIAVGSDGKIVVTDAVNQRVIQIDDMTGSGWKSWSMPAAPSYPISAPAGVAIDALHRIYAVDFEGSVLHRLDDIDGSGHQQYTAPQQLQQVFVTNEGRIFLDLFNGVDAVASIDDMSGAGYTELDGPKGHPFINPCGIVVR